MAIVVAMGKKRKGAKVATPGGKMTLRPAGEILVTHSPTTPKASPDQRIHERRTLPPVPEASPSAPNPPPRDRKKSDAK